MAGKTKLPDFKKMSDREVAKFWDEHDAAEFWPEMAVEKQGFVDKRSKESAPKP